VDLGRHENASAWREAQLPHAGAADRWSGEGYFGARIRDLGVVPTRIAGAPCDDATARFDRELGGAWSRDRARLIAELPSCRKRAGGFRLARDGEACVATLRPGNTDDPAEDRPGVRPATCTAGAAER
jgi:hypothetical protein